MARTSCSRSEVKVTISFGPFSSEKVATAARSIGFRLWSRKSRAARRALRIEVGLEKLRSNIRRKRRCAPGGRVSSLATGSSPEASAA